MNDDKDKDHLAEARELLDEVAGPLRKATKAGVFNPELYDKLTTAQTHIVKGDPDIETVVNCERCSDEAVGRFGGEYLCQLHASTRSVSVEG